MNTLMAAMSRVKRALGIPDTISVLGVVRMCPILVFLSLLILAPVLVMALNGASRWKRAMKWRSSRR